MQHAFFIRMTVIQSSMHEVVIHFQYTAALLRSYDVLLRGPMTSAEFVDDAGKRARVQGGG